MPNPVVDNPQSVKELQTILASNPGVVVLRFTAPWCGPCKRVTPFINQTIAVMPSSVQFVNINIDECIDVYRVFKQIRQVPGVPTCLAFKKGNNSYVPDFNVVGIDPTQLTRFFNRCMQ
jgi:thioredoxin 1